MTLKERLKMMFSAVEEVEEVEETKTEIVETAKVEEKVELAEEIIEEVKEEEIKVEEKPEDKIASLETKVTDLQEKLNAFEVILKSVVEQNVTMKEEFSSIKSKPAGEKVMEKKVELKMEAEPNKQNLNKILNRIK